jgi:hypothetical protein
MVDAVFHHLSNLYKQLEENSTIEDMDGVSLRVFRGPFVRAYRTCAIPQSYYTDVRKSLISMGCITNLRQGARNKPSVIILHKPPELADYEVVKHSDLTPRLDPAILAQRVDDLARQIGGFNILEGFRDHERRLRELELEIARVSQGTTTPKRKINS